MKTINRKQTKNILKAYNCIGLLMGVLLIIAGLIFKLRDPQTIKIIEFMFSIYIAVGILYVLGTLILFRCLSNLKIGK